MQANRHIIWFSCGVASAISAKKYLAIVPTAQLVRIVVKNEHEDNDRFAREWSEHLGKEITELRSSKYVDCWDVWERERWLNGPGGARCTVELKKKVRQEFQQQGDIQVFGYTSDEKERAQIFADNNLEVNLVAPLISGSYTKTDCFRILASTGIKPSIRYQQGYENANCVGCVKGGMGYWNKTRVDNPEVFARMSDLEQRIGASCINGVFLKDLDPEAGRHEDLILPDCGLFCNGY